MSETIYDAFSEFSKKFARFKKSGESLPKRKSEDDFLQDKINAGEAARKQAVSKSYRIYRDPFGELGKTSERARAIYDDEQALLRAYNLFKAVTEASGGKSDKETFVSSFTIESPLARKNAYTFGGNFIYLVCHLMFEEGVSDFVPVLNEEGASYRLSFVPAASFRFEQKDSDVIRIVRETFY